MSRLTDEELSWLERNIDMTSSVPLSRRAIAELRDRRALDLSDEDRELARSVLRDERATLAKTRSGVRALTAIARLLQGGR